ncbi:PD-(D/E)XK nuclease family protein [Lapidilactobacillus mulanensis]|uniref:PD-(D/E)XK nuclease family protein n=1 Tax=Lapidilactobacillus mulanensis TaxID=2485999 RepID=A0ABW4DTB0_9LACO|nr:PD-(D/E)XK nuclease family protein [Lapidilactobacillus mulanensis]
MVMKFIVGKQQDDVSAQLFKQISDDYTAQLNQQFICLVPNHIKFNSEVQILTKLADYHPELATKGIIASSRLQILSFSRLLWYFLRDDPHYQQPQLSDAAQAMFLSDLLQRHRQDLPLFYGESRRIGFLEQLGAQLTELMQGNFTVADLKELVDQLATTQQVVGSTVDKLTELSFIFEKYQAEIADKFTSNEELMAYLLAQVDQRDFSGFHIYLLGFPEFNQQQLALIQKFNQQGATIYLTLYLDPQLREQPTSETYYFTNSLRTLRQLGYDSLQQIPQENWLPVTAKRTSIALQQVENYWIDSTNGNLITAEIVPEIKQDVQIWEADSLTSEVRAVANYIRQLVALQDYRYRDFLVLANNVPNYAATISALFTQNEIPYFSDQQMPMANHPFVLFVKSLLAITQNPLRLEDLLILLRTELLLPEETNLTEFRQELDWLENYAIAFGIRGKTWLKERAWTVQGPYSHQDPESLPELTAEQTKKMAAIEGLHQFIIAIFKPWLKLVEDVGSAGEFAGYLYEFLRSHRVIDRLKDWQKVATDEGDLSLAQEPQQTYQAFINLLDDYVTIWGEQEFDLTVFSDLLNAGFNNTEFSQIPATLDAVLVSNVGMIQDQGHQITILLGATRENIPGQTQQARLIDDQERRVINQYLLDQQRPLQLGETANLQATDQPLKYGAVFLSSQQRLIFSYPKHSDGHADNKLSPYVERIQTFFHLVPTKYHDFPEAESRILDFAASKQGVLGPLLLLAQHQKSLRESLPQSWQWVAQDLAADPEHGEFYQGILASLDYQNIPAQLTSAHVDTLYGQHLFSSVSQLENFYMNPYDYFLKFGLKLHTRDQYTVDSANTGTFFHDYLDHFVKILAAENLTPAELTPEKLTEINQRITAELFAQNTYQILTGPGQMHYYRRQLGKTSAFMTSVLTEQAAHTILKPYRTEVQFGLIDGKTGIPGLEFELDDQKKLSVRGKIDRIDIGELNQTPVYQIIDYKSGDKKFDFTRAYYGLSLQLLTYLQTVADNRHQLTLDNAEPIGAFYLHIADKPLTYTADIDVVNEIVKEHRYKGLLIDQAFPEYLASIDPQAIEQNSLLYPIAYTKKSGFKLTKETQGVTEPELELLLARNRQLLVAAAEEIFSGKLRIAPYKLSDQETGLKYTDYKSIMMFDAMLPENQYRLLPSLDKKTIIETLTQKDGEPADD